MKNTFGNNVCVTLFGESHGSQIGAVLDGMPAGIPVEEEAIAKKLSKRRPKDETATSRVEQDTFHLVSGVKDGTTTGAPICILIDNQNCDSSSYEEDIPRPGHADLTARMKYFGFEDRRGGGHFSGRLTAALVAVGSICQTALSMCGIQICSHIFSVRDIQDRAFENLEADMERLADSSFPVLEEEAGEKMREAILHAKAGGDSLGGIAETVVTDFPQGVGEPWFDTVEGVLSHALFSIPAVKGVEFGDGFASTLQFGSEQNDAICLAGNELYTKTNHAGGINGGISNGMPIRFRVAVKPTPSIAKAQESVNLSEMKPCKLEIRGRHDPCILPRAIPVIDAVTAIVLCDLLAGRYGNDFVGTI